MGRKLVAAVLLVGAACVAPASWVGELQAQAAPTGLTATGGPGAVGVSWSAVTGATSYNVYCATSSTTQPGTPTVTTTKTYYLLSGLTANTTYYFWVNASNGSTTGASTTISAATYTGAAPTVMAAPPATGVGVTATGTILGAATSNYIGGAANVGGYGISYLSCSSPVVSGTNALGYNWSGVRTPAGTNIANGYEQLWYPVPLIANTSYTITFAAASGNSEFTVQGIDGTQVAVAVNPYATTMTVTYTTPAVGGTGTYTIIGTRPNPVAGTQISFTTTVYRVTPSVTSTAVTASSVTLNWNQCFGASGYKIYRSQTSGGEGSPTYTTMGATATTYTDIAVSGGTYYYTVAAVLTTTAAVPLSSQSAEVSATVPGGSSAPTSPTLTATITAGQIVLSWTNSATATSYSIYRASASGGETLYASPAGSATTYTDSGMGTGGTNPPPTGTTYYYKVAASNTTGTSALSNEVSITTIPAASGLSATASGLQIALSWNAFTGATSYNINRGSTSGSETSYVTGVTAATYTDTGLTGGTTYYYTVSAVTSAGTSSASNEASATTAPPGPTISFAVGGPGSLGLQWTAVSGATSYDVYSSTSTTQPGTPTVTTANTYYLLTGLGTGTTYNIWVSAANGVTTTPGATVATTFAYPATPLASPAAAGTTGVSATGTFNNAFPCYFGGTAEANPNGTNANAANAGGFTISYLPDSPSTGASASSGNTWTAGYQQVWYPFPGVANTTYTINLVGTNAATANVMFTLQGTDGTQVGFWPQVAAASTYGNNLSLTYTTPATPPGGTGTYTIIAVRPNDAATGAATIQVTVWCVTPTGVTATATPGVGNAVTLTWNSVYGASSYNIYRSTTSGGQGTTPYATPSGTAASYTDTSATGGVPYYYTVAATVTSTSTLNGTSGATVTQTTLSSQSAQASATPSLAAPTNLSATASGGAITLTWTGSTGAASYNVYRGAASGSEGATPVATVTAPTTAYTDTTVASGTTYYYTVAAVNTGSTSTVSNEASAITTPGAPTGLTATATTAQIVLAWTSVTGASSYNVYRGAASGSEGTTPIATVASPSTSYADSSVTSGTTYFYTVAAVDSSGTSTMSNEASAITAPSAPTGLTATATTGRIALSWTVANGATSYNIYRGSASGSEGSTPTATVTAPTTSYNDSSVAAGTVYYYTVTAINSSGTSTQSNEASALTIPAPPTNLGAAGSTDQIALTWTASTGATSYNIYRGSASGSEGTAPIATVTAPSASYSDSSVAGGTTYYYTVTAINASGTSTPSTEVSALTIPASPTNLSATGSTGQIILSWTASTGATIYNIYRGSATGSEGTTPTATVTAPAASYSDSSVAAGTAYYYTVTAINASGTSTQSTEVSALTIPTSPTNLSATGSASQIALSWTASTGATSYNIYRGSASGSEGATPSATVTAPSTSYTDMSVTNGTRYYYAVAAVNASGISASSNEVSTAPIAPLVISNLGALPPAVTRTGSLSSTSYQGSQANTASSGVAWTPQGTYQDWYQVTLSEGFVYVISMQTTGNSFLSIQDGTNTQVAFNDDANLGSLGSTLASQIVFTPAATGTYTIVCSTEQPATALSYTLTIPLPSPATPTLIPILVGGSASGSLSATSYQGSAASTSQSGGVWTPAGSYQDWYVVSLTGGTTYVISMSTTGNSFLSIQDSTGAQVDWNDDAGANALNGNPLASQLVFTPGATGTNNYTIVCTTELPGTNLAYTITIPNPAPTVTPITVPFPATTLTLSSTSYIGAAAATNMGSPAGGWVDHQQNWYSVYLTALDTYSITMAASGTTTAVLSLQDPNDSQVGFSTGSTASIVYTPSVSGTYTIICSQSSMTSATTSFTLSIPAPILPVGTSITFGAPTVLYPNNALVTVTVNSATGTAIPIGTVALSVDGAAAVTLTLTGGSATFTVTSPGFGNHTLSASFTPTSVPFQPSSNTGTLNVGIPNVRLAPPADEKEALRNSVTPRLRPILGMLSSGTSSSMSTT